MTLWFSYMVSPLGPSLRLRKSFIIGWGDDCTSIIRGKVGSLYLLNNINLSSIDGLYEIAKLDPDIIDTVKDLEEALIEIVKVE